jgi:hypothetical protein
MTKEPLEEFDFDTWATLAEHDPDAFEQARRAVLTSLIAAASVENRQRLAGLQWRLDRIRDRASTPLAACIRLSGLMWDQILGADGLVERLQELSGARPASVRASRTASIVPLRDGPSDT